MDNLNNTILSMDGLYNVNSNSVNSQDISCNNLTALNNVFLLD